MFSPDTTPDNPNDFVLSLEVKEKILEYIKREVVRQAYSLNNDLVKDFTQPTFDIENIGYKLIDEIDILLQKYVM
jgi:hypothetical protein